MFYANAATKAFDGFFAHPPALNLAPSIKYPANKFLTILRHTSIVVERIYLLRIFIPINSILQIRIASVVVIQKHSSRIKQTRLGRIKYEIRIRFEALAYIHQ